MIKGTLTKQGEIQEGIARRLCLTDALDWESLPESGYLNSKDREHYLRVALSLMEFEHSQGVAIKVEKELPDEIPVLPKFYKQGIITEQDLLDYARLTELENRMVYIKAGYVAVEPLIKGA